MKNAMPKYSRRTFNEFDRLTALCDSPRQMDRIEGRLALRHFIAKHGRDVCDAMYEELKKKDQENE